MIDEEEVKYFRDSFDKGLFKIENRQEKHVPLKVTFFLGSPICISHPWIHLDGLISHLIIKEILGSDYFLLPSKISLMKLIGYEGKSLGVSPIKSTAGLSHASISIFDEGEKKSYRVEKMYKRFEDRWAVGRKKISIASGHYRSHILQHIYLPSNKVVFYVCGKINFLDKLLRKVIAIGDNTRVGWGKVQNFIIEEINNDYSLIKGGKAMRPIPERYLVEVFDKVLLAWKPPYWDAKSVELCAVPGSPILLKDLSNWYGRKI